VYDRTCKGCGNEFATTIYRQKFCTVGCGKPISRNRKRQDARLHNDIIFVGVDGEGVDRPDGRHEYVMLSVGDATLWNEGNALSLQSILAFLYDQYTSEPEAAYVGFFLGYDFIQWEKLLPEREARLLLTESGIAERKSRSKLRANPYPDAVVWEGWEIDIMAGRRFKLRPHVHHVSEYNGLCRNRTCRKVMRDDQPTSLDSNEPSEFVPGESHWTLDDNAGTEEYDGDAGGYWDFFTSYRSHSVGQGAHKSKAYGWMYICDTGPFWQTSFLNVINPKAWDGHPVCTDEEYQLVCKGKADRGTVADYEQTDYFEEMREYNVLENDILARVTTRLNQGFMNDRIPIKIPKTDWYGPGRAAQLWMDQLHQLCANPSAVEANRMASRNAERGTTSMVPSSERSNETGLLNADVYMSMPSWFYDAAQASYYGGWFEQFMHGHIGDVWEYDINSAYPFIIASLPCLHTSAGHNGAYTRGNGDAPTDGRRFTLVKCLVTGSSQFIGAMPYRSKQGNISRPNVTEGWYWAHEIDAAKRAGLIDQVDIKEWASYLACECSPPFDPDTIGISRLYQARLDFGKNTPQGKSAKLVYNSAYGKTAQSIGTPKYSNPVYASLITAGCRTLILEAIATHPNGASAVSMVATDGVYFTAPHPSLHLSPTELGAWDETFKPGMTQLMPGVYWDDNTREAIGLGKNAKMKSRGVNAKDLTRQILHLDYLFAQSHQSLAQGGEYVWPEIEFKVDFLLDSAKLALQRGKWDTAGKVTHGSSRKISASPHSKRNPKAYRDDRHGGLSRTYPFREYEERTSTPYSQSFGYQSEEGIAGIFGNRIGRDGDDGMQYWRDLIKGE
jgi:hypothetical protein